MGTTMIITQVSVYSVTDRVWKLVVILGTDRVAHKNV